MMWRTATLSAVGLIFGTLGFLAADREIPVVVYEKGMVDDVVNPGGVGRVRYRFKRFRSCETHVERGIMARDPATGDVERFVVPPLHFSAGILPIGEDVATVPFNLSPQTKPGWTATYRTVNCYKCNFTQHWFPICDAPRDINFTVGPALIVPPQTSPPG